MNKDEYERLKGILERMDEQQKAAASRDREAEERFDPVEKGIAELLAAVKKRISDSN